MSFLILNDVIFLFFPFLLILGDLIIQIRRFRPSLRIEVRILHHGLKSILKHHGRMKVK